MFLTFVFGTVGLGLVLALVALVLLKVLGYIDGQPRYGRARRFLLLTLGLSSILATGVVGVEYIWSNTETVTVHPHPTYQVTLSQNNSDPYSGDVVRFTGLLTLDGFPVSGEPVHLYYNTTGFVATVFTNETGHYTLDWTAPPVTGVTTYDFQARYEKP